MIYTHVKAKKDYLLDVIYKFDTEIQSEVELIMTYMNYGCSDYYLSFKLNELTDIFPTLPIIEIKLPSTVVAEEIIKYE